MNITGGYFHDRKSNWPKSCINLDRFREFFSIFDFDEYDDCSIG